MGARACKAPCGGAGLPIWKNVPVNAPERIGIRPKLQGPGDAFRDYVIEEASRHGAPQLVNLVGIESPGLTASQAIADEVARLIAA